MSSLNTGLVKIPKNNQEYFGGSDVSKGKKSGAGLETIVAPTENTDGIIIYHIATSVKSINCLVSVIMGTSAPTDSQSEFLLMAAWWGSTPMTPFCVSALPLFIPSGNGLYVYSEGAVCNATVIYKVL